MNCCPVRSVIQGRVNKVQNSRQARDQGKQNGQNRGNWETELEKAGRLENTLVRPDKTRRTGNRQTENTGMNTLGIMRKMGDTWRSTKTGETDQAL